ncbi:MAG TPA: hypothetical protein VGJ64_03320 [Gemmatimonadaceae bacterium]
MTPTHPLFPHQEKKSEVSEGSQGVYEIRDFIEFKTTWHPIEG